MIGADPRAAYGSCRPRGKLRERVSHRALDAENASTRSTGILGGNEPEKDRKMTALNN